MKSTLSQTALLLLATVALLSTGCRADRNADLLERDNRLLEDKIYELKDVVREYQDALETCRMKNETPREDSSGPSIGRTEPSGRTDAPDARARRPSFGLDSDKPDALRPPVVKFPDEGTEQSGGTDQPEPDDLQIPDVPDRIKGPSTNELPPAPADNRSTRNKATHLIINAELCHGYDDDNSPGDDGISVSVEPCNARGQAVSAAGDLIVVVRDPQLSGNAAYVARWEFTAEQLAEVLDNSAGGGMHLNLSWPDGRPRHESLDLFVRYITPDGRKLDASEPIGVRLASSSSDGWIVSRNPIRTRRVQGEPAVSVPAEDIPADDALVESDRPRREAVIQAVHEEPVPEEKPAAATLPAWSPNRP